MTCLHPVLQRVSDTPAEVRIYEVGRGVTAPVEVRETSNPDPGVNDREERLARKDA